MSANEVLLLIVFLYDVYYDNPGLELLFRFACYF